MPMQQQQQQVTQEQIQELRNTFLAQLNDDTTTELYHPDDIQRVKENDKFLSRYILHKGFKMDQALKMLMESLEWRKEFQVNTLTRADLPPGYFNSRAVIQYNEDKKGHPVVVVRAKCHIKNEQMIRQQQLYMVYWVEKALRSCNWGAVTILFDCTNSGLSNVDMDMIRFIFSIFKKYYPWSLGHFLICNLPWILQTVWKMIKTWIPEQYVGKVTLVDQTMLREFVSEDNLPASLGGKSSKLYEPKEGAEDVSDDDEMIIVPQIT